MVLLINVSIVVAIFVANQCPVYAQLTMKHCQVYDTVNKTQLKGILPKSTKNVCRGNCEDIRSNAKNENKGLYPLGSLENIPYCPGDGPEQIET